MASYKETLLDILDCLTCPHCKDIFIFPMILDCGHSVCLPCTEMIDSKNKKGPLCYCCPKCGLVSSLWVNLAVMEAAAIVHVVTASLWKERSTPEGRSAGDSDSGVGDLKSEYSLGSSCSISSMKPPPYMASTRELFIRMFPSTDGLESVDELSQRPSGSSDCSEREQRSEDETSARQSLSGSGGLCEPELLKQSAPASTRAPSTDSVTQTTSDGPQGSVDKTRGYKRPKQSVFDSARARIRDLLTIADGIQGSLSQAGWYKQVLLCILESLTCPHCKEIFTRPVTLDCHHIFCSACAEKIGSKNKEGQRCCCCPECGVESVTEDRLSRVNRTLWEVAAVSRGLASLGKGGSTPEVSSAGDSGVGDRRSECSVGSSCSIASMKPPPVMAWKVELFNRMFLPTDGLESEVELSQRSPGSSVSSENEQRSADNASVRRTLSRLGRYLFGGQFESKLPQQSSPCSSRAPSTDLLTQTTSDGTQTSVYKTRWNKQALPADLNPLTCPHCKEIFTDPVTFDCGHSVCVACAEKIGGDNRAGQRCCCPKCGVESVTEDLSSRVNLTLLDVAVVSRTHAAFLEKGRSTPEACSAGNSGVGDLLSECSVGSSCSIKSMDLSPHMASIRGQFIKMFLVKFLESEGELWDCTENKQQHKNQASAGRAFSLFVRYLSRRLRDPELSKKKNQKKKKPHPFIPNLTPMTCSDT